MAKIRNYTENNSWEMAGGKKFRIKFKTLLGKWPEAKIQNYTQSST